MLIRYLTPSLVALTMLWGCKSTEPNESEALADASGAQNRFDLASLAKAYPDFTLYKREAWKGDKTQEIAEFLNQAADVRSAQAALASQNKVGNKRVFHAKNHGCLSGTFKLDPNRDPRSHVGLFSDEGAQEFNVLARFSNGVGTVEHDRKPDVRGFAVKIFGADKGGSSYKTMDILNTNSPNPFGSDQAAFIEFMKANVDKGVAGSKLAAFLATHPAVARQIIKRTLPAITMESVATQTYWSGHPYLMGQDSAVKFIFKPARMPPAPAAETTMSPTEWVKHVVSDAVDNVDYNVMHNELTKRANQGQIVYEVYVQFDQGNNTTPIEDAFVEWTEQNSPPSHIGTIAFDRQNIEDSVHQAVCESLAFTPGRYHPAHRPVGNMGRGRVFTYQASAKGRAAQFDDPDEAHLFATLRQGSARAAGAAAQ